MSEAPRVSPDGAPRGPHDIGVEWLSFEARMRKRRLAKCLLRADSAIEDGNVADACAALDEAQQLEPSSSEAASLRDRLTRIQSTPAAGVSAARVRSRRIRMAWGGGLILLAVGAAFAARSWPSRDAPPSVGTVAAVEPEDARSAGLPLPKPDSRRFRVVRETLRVPEATPRIVEDVPRLPSVPGPPIADAEPESTPVVLAANRKSVAVPPPKTPEVRSELPLEGLPDRPITAPPVRATVPPPNMADPVPLSRAESPPPAADSGTTREASPPRDESVVRAVLQRYEVAYSRLDATAASAVWPGVNKGALARAFDGLASQHVTLGSCDVAVNGPAARATCSGSATWEPKVGGGVRTEARQWNFELRKNDGAWQIERAIAAKQRSELR